MPSRLDDTVRRMRAESVLDPYTPLGYPPEARPEFGMSVRSYFQWKHGPHGPGPGRFWPLHIMPRGDRSADRFGSIEQELGLRR